MFGRFPVKHSASLKWHVQQSGGFLPAHYQRCFLGHVSHRVGVPPRGVLNYNLDNPKRARFVSICKSNTRPLERMSTAELPNIDTTRYTSKVILTP